jgi:hypothetical protein
MAESSKYARLDEDILMEFIYHDQSNTAQYTIENDDNGSQLRFLNLDNVATGPRQLIHELGADVVNFAVTTTGTFTFINSFAGRHLVLKNGKTYKFNLSDVSIDNPDPANNGFVISGGGNILYNNSSKVLTYTPNTNGSFTYTYTNLAGTQYTGGGITIGNSANSLWAESSKQTGNDIKTGASEVGRYQAIPTTSENTYALLENDLNYLDESFWTGTNSGTFDTPIPAGTIPSVVYDTIRLHLRTGYNFSARGYEGFNFQVKIKKTSNVENVFTSIVYLNSSSFEIQNPNPFTLGDSAYSKYIEVRIPSIKHMLPSPAGLNSTFHDNFFGTTTSEKMRADANYEISCNMIDTMETIGSYQYITIGESTNLTLGPEDELQDISVNVTEATDGDYFKIHGMKDSSDVKFENYINDRIQNSSDDIVVYYEVETSEQIGLNYINTYKTTYTHTVNFDQHILHRPVIINANMASSFLIRVTMRIYNETDNSQIVKVGTLLHSKPKKYGKQIEKIDIQLDNPNVIYNKLKNTSVNRELNAFVNSIRPSVGETKYVSVAIDTFNVRASASTVTPDDTEGASVSSANFLEDGELNISVTSVASNYIKFTIARFIEGENRLMDLVGAEDVQITLKIGTKTLTRSHDALFPNVDMSKGEVMFKIRGSDVNALTGSYGDFYIKLRHGDDSSLLYRGTLSKV